MIVGLGNPGPKYRNNRHNVGFLAADVLASRASAGPWKEKFKGEWAKGSLGTGKTASEVVLLKPLTFMNLAGESLQPAMAFFKVPLAKVIVLHDELELEFRDVRVKSGGGAAGHNGLKSIIQQCGGPDFQRVRIGIGRPAKGSPESWVLSDFDTMESAELSDVLQQAAFATERVVKDGPAAAQSRRS